MERSANTIDRPGTAAGCHREVALGGGPETSAFERDCAALDLTDAAQATTRADICRRRGDLTNSRRFDRISRELYARADAHCRRTGHARLG
ncbi:MAG: hypothetical protein L0H96_02295 [Humibacillus sp.]|nr:hypothetical protein [Humibacillus sp.]MDN5775722.1 hypothetical protein [Humibacillus sp.]